MEYFNAVTDVSAELSKLSNKLNEESQGIEKSPPLLPAMPDFDQIAFKYSSVTNCRDKFPKPHEYVISGFVTRFGQHQERADKDGPAIIPAILKKGSTRATKNVESMTALILDVDDGTPYADLLPRVQPFAHFYHTSHSHSPELPKYRVIIFLAEPIPVAEWAEFWLRAQAYFGHMDPSTKDPARLYFAPAHPPDAVFETSFSPGVLLTSAHLPRIEPKSEVRKRSKKDVTVNLAPVAPTPPLVTELMADGELGAVVEKCAFMQYACKPENQSLLPEPLWMGLITNAMGFENSDAWIHTASNQHPGYDEDDTQARIDRYRGSGYKPNTCLSIRAMGFQGCPEGGCKAKNGKVVKAPAALLGWAKVVVAAAKTNPRNIDEGPFPPVYPVFSDNDSDDGVDEHEIKFDDFCIRDSGIYYLEPRRDVNNQPYVIEHRIASRIDIVALARSSEHTDWGVCLEFKDHDGVMHSWCVPMNMLNSKYEYCNTLLSLGAYVSPFHRAELTRLLLTYVPSDRARSVTRPGWEGNQFIFPNGSHVGSSQERISYQTADPTNKAFTQLGSLTDWQENVAKICEGNSRLTLAILAALAGPVLPLRGEESGGFHFPGESSTGKTTALYPACSVWGKPEFFLTRWRGTANGLEANATQRNHTLIALDEMSQVSPKEAGEIVYMLANGQGKARATQEATARAISAWQLMILSTGEVGLEQHMQSAGIQVMAGQQNRLIDIPADAGAGYGVFENIHGSANGAEFSLRIKQQTSRYYGVAGRAWVQLLANPALRPQLLQQIEDYIQSFEKHIPADADGQVRRVARRFAFIAAVGEVCISHGILPWPPGHAIQQTMCCFEQWVAQRGGTRNLERDQALNRIRRFIAESGESAFTRIGDDWKESSYSERITVRRAGYCELDKDDLVNYYIFPSIFREVICAGLDSKQVLKHLKQANALVLDPAGKPLVVKRPPGMKPMRFYQVRSTVLDEPECDGVAGVSVTQVANG